MGSHFLSVYAVPVDRITAVVGSKDLGKLITLGIPDDAEDRPYIERLIQGNYARDPETLEGENAAELVRALAALCDKTATAQVTLEVYDDQDESPELWKFAWSDWEPEEFIELPLSADGSPAVTYKDSNTAGAWLKRFKKVKADGGYNSRYLSNEDLDSLIVLLEGAVTTACGIFAFVEY